MKSVVPPVPERKVSLPVQLPPMAKAQQELIQELKQEVGVQLYNSYITSQECYGLPDYRGGFLKKTFLPHYLANLLWSPQIRRQILIWKIFLVFKSTHIYQMSIIVRKNRFCYDFATF